MYREKEAGLWNNQRPHWAQVIVRNRTTETANKNVRDLAQHAVVPSDMKVHKWWCDQTRAISKEGVGANHATVVGVSSSSEGVTQVKIKWDKCVKKTHTECVQVKNGCCKA